jgi:hypothetical protein
MMTQVSLSLTPMSYRYKEHVSLFLMPIYIYLAQDCLPALVTMDVLVDNGVLVSAQIE